MVLLPSGLQLLSTSHIATNANEYIWQKRLHRCEQSANEGKNQKRPKEALNIMRHVSNVKEKKSGMCAYRNRSDIDVH